MDIYFAAVFTDLVRHSAVWNKVSREAVTNVITEYRYLSQTLASQYGRRHENFTGDGHLFLFESADVAVHFGLKLIAFWKQRRRYLTVDSAYDLPIRVGCHFGECSRLDESDAWIGRVLNIAKRVESSAAPDSLFVTQTILDLIDLPIYEFEEAEICELKGDFLSRRQLYRLISIDHTAFAARPEDRMTAEDWFLKAVGQRRVNDGSSTETERQCYERALDLRANYPEAHNNLGVLLKSSGDRTGAAEQYSAALRLWPRYPEAHYNFAILYEEAGDLDQAAVHYKEAITYRPDYIDAWLRLAGLYHQWGDRIEAERSYEVVFQLRPGFAEAHNNFAVFLEDGGDAARAEHHYQAALRNSPEYPEAHFNYAMFLESRDRARAEAHYRAAIKARSNYIEALNNLAILLQENGDFSAAESYYRAALRHRPGDRNTLYNLATLARAAGDNIAEQSYLEQAAKIE